MYSEEWRGGIATGMASSKRTWRFRLGGFRLSICGIEWMGFSVFSLLFHPCSPRFIYPTSHDHLSEVLFYLTLLSEPLVSFLAFPVTGWDLII